LEMRRRANESDEKFLHSNLTPLLQNATEVLRDEEKPVVCAMNRKRKLLVLFFGTAFFSVLWIEFSLFYVPALIIWSNEHRFN
jgi:hypothetical protein